MSFFDKKKLLIKATSNCKNGHPSVNNTTRLIERDAHHKQKKLRDASCDNTIIVWYFAKVVV